MYAVIRNSGKQHRVSKGDRIKVDTLVGDVGTTLTLDDVLMIGGEDTPKIGQPVVEGASVSAKILAHGKHGKIDVFKKKRRKGFHKTIGHRQPYTEIEITEITG
ncbi:MAG: 50S ribosomal protein L21 [Myxococcales bacterium]|nr:50S ribosomal protein L21 [Myxococcales bacterium]|tara:strand:- start:1050 stop:1361 length:312 start_codon:yes stop_codon:yes gene_type:complete